MASEVNHHVGYSRENECWFVRFYPYQTEQQASEAAAAFTRPAPVATDTGLVTVAWRERSPTNNYFTYHEYPTPLVREKEELVTRSQADELLAAERAETERLADDYQAIREQLHRGWQECCALKADNAAKETRIKELEEEVEWAQNAVLARQRHAEARCETLEAKLAAAEKALTMIAKIELSFPEELRDIARAVLGRKPS